MKKKTKTLKWKRKTFSRNIKLLKRINQKEKKNKSQKHQGRIVQSSIKLTQVFTN